MNLARSGMKNKKDTGLKPGLEKFKKCENPDKIRVDKQLLALKSFEC